jgi:two-component system phosphate regulon sensor histidine kinase PhoR
MAGRYSRLAAEVEGAAKLSRESRKLAGFGVDSAGESGSGRVAVEAGEQDRRGPVPVALLVLAPLLAAIAALWLAGLAGPLAVLVLALAAAAAAGLAHLRFARHAAAVAQEADERLRDLRSARAADSGRASAADAMLDSLTDPVLLVDAARVVTRANAAAADLLGQGLGGQDLALSLRHPAVLEAVGAALAGAQPSAQLEITLGTSPAREFAARIVTLPRPEGAQAVIALHDLTALRRAEQMRADFVANASHELRTPLATLVGFVETLQGPAKDDADARERFLAIMAEQAGRMTRLIRDLLSLSQIEMNEHSPPRTRLDLRQVLRGTGDMMQIEAQKANVTLALDIPEAPIPVTGETDELTQVFQNLIDNAIKYGGRDSTVTVAAKLAARGVSVAINDRGPGIPREHLPRLTERFYRVDSARSRALGGTGLGLAIVKHIVNRHRGALTIDSVVGQGSTFTVTLPLAE